MLIRYPGSCSPPAYMTCEAATSSAAARGAPPKTGRGEVTRCAMNCCDPQPATAGSSASASRVGSSENALGQPGPPSMPCRLDSEIRQNRGVAASDPAGFEGPGWGFGARAGPGPARWALVNRALSLAPFPIRRQQMFRGRRVTGLGLPASIPGASVPGAPGAVPGGAITPGVTVLASSF